MYAVIETGGKQYRVEVGTELEVELLDVEAGDAMKFDRILLVADGDTAAIGRPTLANAEVAATVLGRDRGEKTISFKYRPKARRRVKKGHRQELTLLRISDIVLDGHSAAADVAKADEARKRDRSKLEEAARRQAEADAELAAKLAAEKPVASEKSARAAKSAGGEKPAGAETSSRTTGKRGATSSETTAEKASSKGGGKTATASATGPTAARTKAKADTNAASAPKKASAKTPEKKTEKQAPGKRTTKKES